MILKTKKQAIKKDKTASEVVFNKFRRIWRTNESKSIELEEIKRKTEKENTRLKKENEDIKTIKASKNLHSREQMWQVETRKQRRNTNKTSPQNMINGQIIVGTEEDPSQTIDRSEEFQSATILPTHSQNKRRPNVYIAGNTLGKIVPGKSIYVSIAKQVKEILVIGC